MYHPCSPDFLAAGMLSASAPAPFFALASGNREQYLVPAIPAWQQVNSNGFGDPQAPEVSALEAFNGYLYAGTHNPVNPAPGQLYDGAQIFRSPDGSSWTPVTQPGFGNTHDIAPPAILDFLVFNRLPVCRHRPGQCQPGLADFQRHHLGADGCDRLQRCRQCCCRCAGCSMAARFTPGLPTRSAGHRSGAASPAITTPGAGWLQRC